MRNQLIKECCYNYNIYFTVIMVLPTWEVRLSDPQMEATEAKDIVLY